MKKFTKIAAVALFGFTALGSTIVNAAGTTSGTFNVNITLNASCSIATAITDMSFTYDSFVAASAIVGTTANVTCTSGLPYGIGLDAVSVTDNAVQIAYTITGVPLGAPTSGQTGNGIVQAYTLTPAATAGQGGACGTAGGICINTAATNKLRTLTVSW